LKFLAAGILFIITK
jgi:hypothetical protein